MNYELAKQLSDAGFPQGGEGKWVLPPDIINARREDRVYVPTLSELIEACGSKFQALFREPDRWTAQQGWGPLAGLPAGSNLRIEGRLDI